MTDSDTTADPFSPTPNEIKTAGKMIAADLKGKALRSLDDEREFMENLLVQRLNFLLVVFSIFVAAGFGARTSWLAAIVFLAGAFICYLMAKIVYRAHVKHHWIMRLFYKQPEPATETELPHAIKFVNDAMKTPERKARTRGSVSELVGDKIPTVCWVFLFVCALVSLGVASLPFMNLPSQLRDLASNPQETVTFIDQTGKQTVRTGRIIYRVHASTVELTVIDTSNKVSILVVPVDRFLGIER